LFIFYLLFIRAADCYPVVAVAVNKQGPHKFHMERFNLKKLNEVEGKGQYCVEVSNRFAALEHLDAEMDINSAWEMIRENITFQPKRV
jgi:hypothetical protein